MLITHVIWDLGGTIITPPPGGQDLKPLDQYSEIELRPNVKEILQAVAELGYVQAVLSNTATSDSNSAHLMLERLGVADKFAYVYATQSELTHDKPEKPDPAVFQIVLHALGTDAIQAVMIGNSWEHDILGAYRSGIHGIWIRNSSVSIRNDWTTEVESPPLITSVWDVEGIPYVLKEMQNVINFEFGK